MIIQVEEANAKLKSGEFEQAKQIFSSLLDDDPESIEIIAGYFIASYWDNRLEKIFYYKEGKERGLLLDKLFREFEIDYSNRGYPKNSSYQAVKYSVLHESCLQIRLGFHLHGKQILDKETVFTLARNLFKIQDYYHAIDMIDYSSKYQETPPVYYFYKAECLFHLGEHTKSRILFRSCLLHYPDVLPIEEIRSEPLHTAIWELKERFENLEDLKEYLPIYCIEKNYFTEIAEYTKEDINHFVYEMNQIEESVHKRNFEFTFKLKCRFLNLGFTILDTFHAQINSELNKKIREKLMNVDAGALERRDIARRKIKQE